MNITDHGKYVFLPGMASGREYWYWTPQARILNPENSEIPLLALITLVCQAAGIPLIYRNTQDNNEDTARKVLRWISKSEGTAELGYWDGAEEDPSTGLDSVYHPLWQTLDAELMQRVCDILRSSPYAATGLLFPGTDNAWPRVEVAGEGSDPLADATAFAEYKFVGYGQSTSVTYQVFFNLFEALLCPNDYNFSLYHDGYHFIPKTLISDTILLDEQNHNVQILYSKTAPESTPSQGSVNGSRTAFDLCVRWQTLVGGSASAAVDLTPIRAALQEIREILAAGSQTLDNVDTNTTSLKNDSVAVMTALNQMMKPKKRSTFETAAGISAMASAGIGLADLALDAGQKGGDHEDESRETNR
jgi:hypothetical protein